MTDIPKPAYGSPCNGCGMCCQRSLCTLAEITFPGAAAPCPALRMGPAGSQCGLLADPAAFAPARVAQVGEGTIRAAAALSIGAGLGCDAFGDDEDETKSGTMAAAFMAKTQSLPERLQNAITMAVSIWLVPPADLPRWMRHAEPDMVACLKALKE